MSSANCEALLNTSSPGWQAVHVPYNEMPPGSDISLGFFFVLVVLTCASLVLLAFFKYVHPRSDEFARLRVRPFRFTVLTHLGFSMSLVTGMWNQSHSLPESSPVWVFIFCYFSIVPLLAFPLVVRLLSFYRGDRLADYTLQVAKVLESQNKLLDKVGGMDIDDNASSVSPPSSFLQSLAQVLMFRGINTPTMVLPENDASHLGTKSPSSLSKADRQKITAMKKFHKQQDNFTIRLWRFFQGVNGATLILALAVLPYFITVAVKIAINPMVPAGCWGWVRYGSDSFILIIESVVAIIVLVLSYWSCTGKADTFGIVNEVRMCVWFGGVPSVLFLILLIVAQPRDSEFTWDYMIALFLFAYCQFQSFAQVVLAIKEDRAGGIQDNHVDRMSEVDFIPSIMGNTNGALHLAFSEHLVSEHGVESITFYDAVAGWELAYYDISPTAQRSRAKKIIATFVGITSLFPCNLSGPVRIGIEKSIEADNVPVWLFAEAKKEIAQMLYNDAFSRFCRTKAYAEALQPDLKGGRAGAVVPKAGV